SNDYLSNHLPICPERTTVARDHWNPEMRRMSESRARFGELVLSTTSLACKKVRADKTADKNWKARISRACKCLILNWSHPPGFNRRPAITNFQVYTYVIESKFG